MLNHQISIHKCGSINGNNLVDDGRGKKIIDTIFRIHRQMSDNRFQIVGLCSGAPIQDEKLNEWYGPGMASFCQSNPGHYLSVLLDRENDRYWGYLPATKP